MSGTDFTPSQRAAIESRGSAILVAAGAGSGKTRVLTERLIGYLTDKENPRDVDSFLVITFTRAAAAELKGRILEEIARQIAADPGNRHLRRQSALCRRAQIGTIHGFCSELLRQNCQSAGLAPDFRVIEEERADAMKSAALERVMDACYAAPDSLPGFLELADTVGAGRDDRRLCELVLELHGKMQCHARPERWAEEVIERLRAPAGDLSETPWGGDLLESLRRRAAYWSGETERLLGLLGEAEMGKGTYGESLMQTAEALREFDRALRIGWDAARERLPIPFEKVTKSMKSLEPELAEEIKARRDRCKKACARMAAEMASPSEKLLAGMARTHDAMEALLRLTLRFDEQYAKDKRRGSLVDYADLEHFAARLLTEEDGTPSALAKTVAARYTEVMVDEYQDVSLVQDAIFRAVSREGRNLFFVGDVKQSIYRFRLADPQIFTKKYDAFADWEKAGEGEPRRILLRENFRSRREILEAANAVFSACMSRELGELDYDETAALRFGAKEYEGEGRRPELLLAARGGAGDEETPDRLEHEAELVAREIERMLREGVPVTEEKTARPARPGDFAILLRTANAVGPVFRRALVRRGIPVASAQGGEFFSSPEIAALMSLLAILDNPHQDIPLIAALRAPCFGFTPDELSAIRAADRSVDFYTALCKRAAAGDSRCGAFLAALGSLRELAPDLACAELVWKLVNELDMLPIAGAMDDGERRRANLMEFVALSERFESTGYRGLHRFVLWLRRLAEKGREQGGAGAAGVQILSVHKSKGLQFPIVLLCDLAHRFNRRDGAARVLIHPQLGLGAKVTDLERRAEYPTLARTAIARRLEREMLSEEMRLLYVAMTRAKEYLLMTASVKDPAALIAKARPTARLPLDAEQLASAACPLDWLLSAALADGERHLKLRIVESAGDEDAETPAAEAAAPDEAFAAALAHRLAFVYPHAAATALPSKVTATELKDRLEADGEARSIAPRRRRAFRRPDFSRADKPLSGAERGTATHLVLQGMDFSQTGSVEAVRGEIERMLRARCLSEREAAAVDAEAIVKLFASPLGQRMLHADAIRREFKFSLLCGARELLGADADERILLQGVVDCCLEEDGELVVIDYKTDAVRSEAQIAERRALYTPQLRAYAAALERIFSKRVKECVLYFLAAGKACRVETEERRGALQKT